MCIRALMEAEEWSDPLELPNIDLEELNSGPLQNSKLWAGEMGEQVRTLAILAEDLGSVLSIYMAVHKCL